MKILLRNKFIATEAKSLDDYIAVYEQQLTTLKKWKEAGGKYLEGAGDDYGFFEVPADVELGFAIEHTNDDTAAIL